MLVGTASTTDHPVVTHLVSRRDTALCGAGPLRVTADLDDEPGAFVCRACVEAALRRPDLVA